MHELVSDWEWGCVLAGGLGRPQWGWSLVSPARLLCQRVGVLRLTSGLSGHHHSWSFQPSSTQARLCIPSKGDQAALGIPAELPSDFDHKWYLAGRAWNLGCSARSQTMPLMMKRTSRMRRTTKEEVVEELHQPAPGTAAAAVPVSAVPILHVLQHRGSQQYAAGHCFTPGGAFQTAG